MITTSSRTTSFDYAIRDLTRAAEVYERTKRHKVIYLNIGDPQAFSFRPPEHITETVARALRDSFTGYAHSTGLPDARTAVAAYATAFGAPTNPDEVLITSGASEAADLVLTALVNEGDEVLMPAPGYPLYPAVLSKLGAAARYYHLNREHNWQPSLNEIGSLVNARTRAIVLINPNNPTGSILPDTVTRQLLELAARHNLLVIADEVYRELCFDTAPTSASIFAEEMNLPLITLESLSKTHLIPGWRVGWMRFTHAERMRDLIASITRLAGGRLCSPTPTQYAIRPALEGDRKFMADFMRQVKQRRDFAVEQVRLTPELCGDSPAAAFYMMIKVKHLTQETDARFVLDLLEATGVLVVHGSGFGANPHEGYFRMVYLADVEMLGDVFDRMRDFFAMS